LTKPEGTARVLCLGDSITFGWALNRNESYPGRLQKSLTRQFPNQKIEVINAGIPTHSSFQGLCRLKYKTILEIQPDLVVISYGFNDRARLIKQDRELIARMKNPEPVAGLQKMFRRLKTYRLLFSLIQKIRVKQMERSELRQVRVTMEEFKANFTQMDKLVKASGGETIFLSQVSRNWTDSVEYNNVMASAAEEKGCPFINLHKAMRIRYNTLLPGEALFIDTIHPSSIGCEVIADQVAEVISKMF